ncbi:hypothetical protein S40285_04716 [Stachybotrys chlorohalonatus IBT 40285]|uniref:Uncharacterized protein n=1 Tax=Stachybotrys chlorohalonatus (strain IBT 40285) TaxID=1283841 RepID=A0A084Q9V2_STAC4|nr:hypothetical protein S40285_04716 [Stachybotrys chlorohalonata IBT 40285]
MKVASLPVAALLLAGSANALFGKKPPPKPKTEVVSGFKWNNPFEADTISDYEADCGATSTFNAYEYTLHDLMAKFPEGLGAWAPGLKSLFSQREYPGSWGGWDRHLHDRSILLMEYKNVPSEVRNWIEEQDRTDGPGKGLFGVFKKPTEEEEKIKETVTFSEEGENKRGKDEDMVVIFAPGALYEVLPLWTAGDSPCKDDLLDLSKYKPTPEAGAVVAWPENQKPTQKKMEFVVKAQVLKAKVLDPSSAPSDETAETKEEL